MSQFMSPSFRVSMETSHDSPAAASGRRSGGGPPSKGEIVWAKAFPQPWCPAIILRTNGARALVASFVSGATRWYAVSSLLPFEINYARIITTVAGTDVSDEIALALQELSRRVSSALTCSCRRRTAANLAYDNQIAGFEPREMLGFVLDSAVSVFVDEEDAPRVVRASAHANAFRGYVSAREDVETLGFVREMAAGAWADDDEEDTRAVRAYEMVCALRRHGVVHREFGVIGGDVDVSSVVGDACQEDTGLDDSSSNDESEGSDEEVSDLSAESGIVYGVPKLQDDFPIEIQEEGVEIFQEPLQEGSFTCTINSMDDSIFDSDGEYGYLSDNKPCAVTDCTGSAGVGKGEYFEEQKMCSGSSSQESNMRIVCCKSSSLAEDCSENVGNGTVLRDTLKSVDYLLSYDANRTLEIIASHRESSHMVQSGEDVAFGDVSTTSSETKIADRLDEFTSIGEQEISDSSLLVSPFRSLLRTTPCEEGQSILGLASHCDTHSLDQKLKRSVGVQPSPSVSLVNSITVHEPYTANIIPDPSPPHKTASGSDNQPFAVTEIGLSGISRNECFEEHSSSSKESHMGTAHGKSSSHAEDSKENGGNGNVTVKSVDYLPSYDANHTLENVSNHWESVHIVQSGKDVAFDDISITGSETKMKNQQDEVTTTGEHEINHLLVSSCSSLPRTTPGEEGQGLMDLNASFVESVNVVETCSANIIPDLSPPNKIASGIDNQPFALIETGSAGLGRNGYAEDKNLCTGSSSQKFHMGTPCCKSFSLVEDSSENTGNESELYATVKSKDYLPRYNANHTQENVGNHRDSVHIVQSGKDVASDGMPITCLETRTNRKYEVTAIAEHDIVDSSLIVSSSSSLLRVPTCEEGQLLRNLASHSCTYSPDEKLNHGAELQPSTNASLVNRANVDETCSANIIAGLSPGTQTASGSVMRKRKHDSTITCNNSLKLHKTMTWGSKAIASTRPLIECNSSIRSQSEHEVVADHSNRNFFFPIAHNNGTGLHSGENPLIVSGKTNAEGKNTKDNVKGDKTKAICSLTLPIHVAKSNPRKKALDQSVDYGLSNRHTFYASPLMECPNSTKNDHKTLVADTPSILPKSLHMKFPKNFNLPSKEDLEKKFAIFGPLDCSKTKLFFYTGSGRVVFLKHADAVAAYKHVKKTNIFGQFNVLFWFDEFEMYRKERETQNLPVHLPEHSSPHLRSCSKESCTPIAGPTSFTLKSHTRDLSVPKVEHSTSNLKPCLKRPNIIPGRDTKKARRVRFLMETS